MVPGRSPGAKRTRRVPDQVISGVGISFALAVFCVVLSLHPSATSAMAIVKVGDQLILSGPILGDEPDRVGRLLNDNPNVTTVVLRDSPGGEAVAGYRVGEMIRSRGLRTAVSGFCYSSCSRMFLGGKVRVFTDDDPPEATDVGFHGHYRSGRLDAELVQRLDLFDWIMKYSDGKADPALVRRWINIPVNRGLIHFFHPTRLRGHNATTFVCDGSGGRSVFTCEPEPRSALTLGIITSLDVISSNDRRPAVTRTSPGPRPDDAVAPQ